MTALINNSTSQTCSICHEDFIDVEKTHTKKIIELACHHFYHMQCIGSWFSHSESQVQDLSCCYCSQSSIERLQYPESFNLETITAFLEKIKENPVHQSNRKILDSVAKLSSLSQPLATLLNDIAVNGESVEEDAARVKSWIEDNIEKELRVTAGAMVIQLLKGSQEITSLQEQVKYLANIPYKEWPNEIEKLGVSIYDSANNLDFRIKVSKEYLQRAVTSYLSERIQNITQFKSFCEQLTRDFYYDDKVLEALPHAKNLYKDFLQLLQNNPVSSRDEMVSLLENAKDKLPIKEDVKETVGFILNKFLFRRNALRTLSQELKIWGKEPKEKIPPLIRHRGIRVLDEKDPNRDYQVKNFQELLNFHRTQESGIDLTKPLLLAFAVAMIGKFILGLRK